jgi:hypothetical protein
MTLEAREAQNAIGDMRSSVLEHVVKHDEIVCLQPEWNLGCAPELCTLNRHVLNFWG